MTEYDLGPVVGEKGQDGLNGLDGQDGLGIKNVTIEDNILTIIYTDDSQDDFELNITSGDKFVDSITMNNNVMTVHYSNDDSDEFTLNISSPNPSDDMSLYALKTDLDTKVDKVNGKGLSSNDYTNTDKTIVSNITSNFNNKVDKISGKGLSSNDYTNADKNLVSTIPNKANTSDIANTYATTEYVNSLAFDPTDIDMEGYIKTSEIVDDLDTDISTKVLSAKQGYNIKHNFVQQANGASQMTDATQYSNIGSSANATQATINQKIDAYIYGNGQAILAVEQELLRLAGLLNALDTNLVNFNGALIGFDSDSTNLASDLSKLKDNLDKILQSIKTLQTHSSEFGTFMNEFSPKLETLDITLSALYTGLVDFEGTLDDFVDELESHEIDISELDGGIKALLTLIFNTKEQIESVEGDIGPSDGSQANTLWYHIKNINDDIDPTQEGSLAYLVNEAKDKIGDIDVEGSILYIINQMLNTDIPNLQELMYGSGVDDNGDPYDMGNPHPNSIKGQIQDIQNNSIVTLRREIQEALGVANIARQQADDIASVVNETAGQLWGYGANNDKDHLADGSILKRLQDTEQSVDNAAGQLWGYGADNDKDHLADGSILKRLQDTEQSVDNASEEMYGTGTNEATADDNSIWGKIKILKSSVGSVDYENVGTLSNQTQNSRYALSKLLNAALGDYVPVWIFDYDDDILGDTSEIDDLMFENLESVLRANNKFYALTKDNNDVTLQMIDNSLHTVNVTTPINNTVGLTYDMNYKNVIKNNSEYYKNEPYDIVYEFKTNQFYIIENNKWVVTNNLSDYFKYTKLGNEINKWTDAGNVSAKSNCTATLTYNSAIKLAHIHYVKTTATTYTGATTLDDTITLPNEIAPSYTIMGNIMNPRLSIRMESSGVIKLECMSETTSAITADIWWHY